MEARQVAELGKVYDGERLEEASRLCTAADILGLRWRLERTNSWDPKAPAQYLAFVESVAERPAEGHLPDPKSFAELLAERVAPAPVPMPGSGDEVPEVPRGQYL